MRSELLMALVVVAPDGGLLDGSVHAFGLSVGPGLVGFGETVFDAVLTASHVEHVRGVSGCRSVRSEEHTSELQSLMRLSYAAFCVKHKKDQSNTCAHACT